MVLRKIYRQDWENYDKAKTNEDVLFKNILRELLYLSIDSQEQSNGRPKTSIEDQVFSMAIKMYYKSDLRKTHSILKELKQLGYIYKVPCYKSIDNFFNNKLLPSVIDKLILLSALPLSQLEDTCAMDSTGFSTSTFQNWNKYKWGKHSGRERVWKKAHATLGCKTNVFISVEITDSTVADKSMLEKTVGNNLQKFSFDKFVADRGYISRDIFKFLHELGLLPIIPFKTNCSAKPKGVQIWKTMFEMFHNQNDKFMKMYHQRNNIETGFHMIKKRFGNSLSTRTKIANINEIKMKFLCHNICVLIQEMFESDIKINFEDCVKQNN